VGLKSRKQQSEKAKIIRVACSTPQKELSLQPKSPIYFGFEILLT
jgi:hypothetical protein